MMTGAAMGVGAAVAGLAWYTRRRALRMADAAVPAVPVRGRRRGA
jgi:hypothetical protein